VKPPLEDIGGFLGQITAALPVESVGVHTDVVMESDLVVARLVSCM
jgi:hypothetical protein